MVGLVSKLAQLRICQSTYRNTGSGMCPDISITMWIVAANIEHGVIGVFAINPIRWAQHCSSTTILATHAGRVNSFLLTFHISIHLHLGIKKGRKTAWQQEQQSRFLNTEYVPVIITAFRPMTSVVACAVWIAQCAKSVTVPLPRGESNSGSSSEVLKAWAQAPAMAID